MKTLLHIPQENYVFHSAQSYVHINVKEKAAMVTNFSLALVLPALSLPKKQHCACDCTASGLKWEFYFLIKLDRPSEIRHYSVLSELQTSLTISLSHTRCMVICVITCCVVTTHNSQQMEWALFDRLRVDLN